MRLMAVNCELNADYVGFVLLRGACQLAGIHHFLQLVYLGKQPGADHRAINSDNEVGSLPEYTVYEMLPVDLSLLWADAVGSREITGARTIGLQRELHILRSLESPDHCCLVNAGPFKGDGCRAGSVSPAEK